MKHDYLEGTEYEFEQDDAFLKVSKDTYLLGSFVEAIKGKTVLDIGTNTGALLLYALKMGAKKLVGIDINIEALDFAKRNLSRYTNDFILYQSRIQDFAKNSPIDPVDIIVCNPPFFDKGSTQRENQHYNEAMFDEKLSIEDLCFCIKKLLKDNGSCYLIYQADRIAELFRELQKNKLKVMKMQFVSNDNAKECHRVLLKIKHGNQSKLKVQKERVIIH